MAKNLKLKVKNEQLAKALNLNKFKKKPSEETKEAPAKKKPPEKATASKEKGPKKPEAQIIRKASDIKAEEARRLEAAEEAKKAPKVEEPPKDVAPPEVTPKEEPPKEEAATPSTTEPAKEKEATPAKEKPPLPDKKPLKDKRDTKVAKKPQTYRPFDSRDRLGLRSDEEVAQPWRRRRSHKHHRSRDSRQIEPQRPKEISIRFPITVKDLAHEMKLKASELIQKLFLEGLVITVNDYIEDETILEIISHEFKVKIDIDTSEEKRLKITDKTVKEEIAASDAELLTHRDPIITFMGHVDHGKTSLVDFIRKSNIASGESGAITQHIGAFKATTSHGDITILDTPGHEAFTLMRERGASITDIVVLVVAGDEGIKQQTDEAIRIVQEAKIPLIIAINKSDKPGYNPDEIYRQLADRNLLPEAWGGEILTVKCSAATGEGIPELLETSALQAEMLELKANSNARARGSVIESELHKGLGSVATILVQNGTLKPGDALVLDHIWGRVKTMHNDHGKNMPFAGPSTPVKITGLSNLPEAGAEFIAVESEKEARKLATERSSGAKVAQLKQKSADFDSILERESEMSRKKVLNIIIRADVQGSVEALKNSIEKIKSAKVEPNIVSAEVGEVSESDVELAAASGAVIIGFHTHVESNADSLVKRLKVSIRNHDVIYHVIDDVKDLMRALLDKVRVEHYSGTADVKQTFRSSQVGIIAGCYVSDGVVARDHYAKVYRNNEIVWEGSIASLKRVNEDVKSVSKGLECGILLSKFRDIYAEDQIKTYKIEYINQDL